GCAFDERERPHEARVGRTLRQDVIAERGALLLRLRLRARVARGRVVPLERVARRALVDRVDLALAARAEQIELAPAIAAVGLEDGALGERLRHRSSGIHASATEQSSPSRATVPRSRGRSIAISVHPFVLMRSRMRAPHSCSKLGSTSY